MKSIVRDGFDRPLLHSGPEIFICPPCTTICFEPKFNHAMSSGSARPTRALVVKKPWARLLVNGVKTVEIRGSSTKLVGNTIAVAQSGSQVLLGEVFLESCRLVAVRNEQGSLEDVPGERHTLKSLKFSHCIEDLNCIPYNRVYAWFVTNNVAYFTPVPYVHPPGAVCWVDLEAKSAGQKACKRVRKTNSK